MRSNRLFGLAVFLGLGLAFVAWLEVEDARQAATLDARIQNAAKRVIQIDDQRLRLVQNGAPAGEVAQASREVSEARAELKTLRDEKQRQEEGRKEPWHTRLRREVRRRIGW